MVSLKGRNELECKDLLGGVKRVYLFQWVEPSELDMILEEGVELSLYPTTPVYKYNFRGDFEYTEGRDDNGRWSQSLSFNFKKIVLSQSKELAKQSRGILGCIFEDRKGRFRIMGLRNGCDVSFSTTTGGGKGSFTGYDITLTATEEYNAPFIDDLTSTGFTPEVDVENRLLASTDVLASTDLICSEITY